MTPSVSAQLGSLPRHIKAGLTHCLPSVYDTCRRGEHVTLTRWTSVPVYHLPSCAGLSTAGAAPTGEVLIRSPECLPFAEAVPLFPIARHTRSCLSWSGAEAV